MATDNKVKSIFALMELLVDKKEIWANDKKVAEEMGYTTKTLGRHLSEIATMYSNIIEVKRGKNHVYELVDVSYVFEKIMKTTDDFNWFFDLVDRWDSSIFNDINYKASENDRDVFLYKNSPFEELSNEQEKDFYRNLKSAIVNREYRDIYYIYDKERVHVQAIPLKLIFMEQNWYVAIVDKDTGFRFLRISFITNLISSKKTSYAKDISKKELKIYQEFLRVFQNSLTLFGVEKKVAHILVAPIRAKYFKPNMKKFLNSQEFVKEHDDGSIEFKVEYTQPLEIFRLIKHWLPDLRILSPKELDDALRADLEAYLK